MPATPWALYGAALEAILAGSIDLDNDSFRMVLVSGDYVPDQAADAAWSEISENEITGTGYTAGGKATPITLSRMGLAVSLDTSDVSWPSSTLTATYAVIVRDAGGAGALAASDLPICFCELEDGAAVSTTNGTLAVTVNAAGLYTFTAAAAA